MEDKIFLTNYNVAQFLNYPIPLPKSKLKLNIINYASVFIIFNLTSLM